MFHVPETCRITEGAGPYTTRPFEGQYGAFLVDSPEPGWKLLILATDGLAGDEIDFDGLDARWEHVSISARNGSKVRTPNWKEMCHIKDLFWDEEDVVMQLHPRKSEYVNMHPHTLHLWRPLDQIIPEPPSHLVGPK